MWSDPDKDITGWSENDRGVSFTFGPDVVSRFLQKHDMDLICRAHQVVEDGYEFFSKRQLVTLFSAPNYCGEFDNAGAMMSVDESLLCSFQVGCIFALHHSPSSQKLIMSQLADIETRREKAKVCQQCRQSSQQIPHPQEKPQIQAQEIRCFFYQHVIHLGSADVNLLLDRPTDNEKCDERRRQDTTKTIWTI